MPLGKRSRGGGIAKVLRPLPVLDLGHILAAAFRLQVVSLRP
jgi:hypothetical protein